MGGYGMCGVRDGRVWYVWSEECYVCVVRSVLCCVVRGM